MSFQAGVRYFDQRPVESAEIIEIQNGLRTEDYPVLSHQRQPGLLLAFADRRSAHRNPAITFDGRLDNRDDLLLQLKEDLGEDKTDASLALAVYRRWGGAGLVHLIGDWSLVLWDAEQQAIVLASDFAGVRPLYYCVQTERVVWSTRLAALADLTQAVEIDDAYVGTLLGCSQSMHQSPYKGILSVPAGHAIRVTAGRVVTQRFWSPPTANSIQYERPSAYEEELRALFRNAVHCRLRKTEAVIADLSGGLDSSSVVSMARTLSASHRLPRLVTVTLEHAKSLDTPFYRVVEKFCQTEPRHIATCDHVLLGEGLAGHSRPATWQGLQTHIAGIARQAGANIYLTGQFGDFIMGNRWDDSAQIAGLLNRGNYGSALRASIAWSKVLRIPVYWVAWRALLSSLPANLTPARLLSAQDGPYAPQNTEDSIAPEFRKRIDHPDPSEQFWKQAPPERRKHWYELWQILQSRKLQPPEPLEHLEYTHPYAHRPLVEFMLSIPAGIVCGPGEPRRLMRRAFSGLWPAELRKRRSKDTFGGVLLETLRPLAGALAREPARLLVVQRGYVERNGLEQRLNRLANALECNEPQLRQIILLELWLRDQEQRPGVKSRSAFVSSAI